MNGDDSIWLILLYRCNLCEFDAEGLDEIWIAEVYGGGSEGCGNGGADHGRRMKERCIQEQYVQY